MRRARDSSALLNRTTVLLVLEVLGVASTRVHHTQEVLFVGCAEVTSDSVCRLAPPVDLTVWVATADKLRVALDGSSIHVAPRAVLGGSQLRITVDAVPSTLSIRVSNWPSPWTLSLEPQIEHQGLSRAQTLRGQGKFEEAKSILQPLTTHREVYVRAKAIGTLGRIAMAEGSFQESIDAFGRSIKLHHNIGAVWSEMDDRFALSYVQGNLGDYATAESTLEGVDAIAPRYPGGALYAGFYRASLAGTTSDLRRALTIGAQMLIDAERLDLDLLWRATAMRYVNTLLTLGRRADAQELLATIITRTPDRPACARAVALEVSGRLMRMTANDTTSDREGVRVLEEAAELYRSQCHKPRHYAYTLALLGSAALDDNDTERASTYLYASRNAHDDPGVALRTEQASLDAALALAQGDTTRAAEAYHRLALIGRLHKNARVELDALVGEGRAHERAGRSEEAVQCYRRAETLLERLSFRAPLGAGRASLIASGSQSAQRLVDLLVGLGRIDEALAAARRSRARTIRSVSGPQRLDGASDELRKRWYDALAVYRAAQRATSPTTDDWGLATEELDRRSAVESARNDEARRRLDEALSELGAVVTATESSQTIDPGVLLLTYHSVDAGWIGFATTSSGTHTQRLDAIDVESADPATLSKVLLEPFDASLDAVEQVRILPHGALAAVDFHALPWRGRPLVASRIVTFPLDIAVASTRSLSGRTHATVIAPHDRLRASKREAGMVNEALRGTDWNVDQLSGSQATPNAIRERIGGADIALLHYAGHATFKGLDGWESFLGTSNAVLLSVPDILTLPSTPPLVVLSACETAATGTGKNASSLGLAQAFVMNGSRWVVAAVRPIRDTDAIAVITELYREQARRNDWDMPRILAAAQARLAREQPAIDWASFRVIEP